MKEVLNQIFPFWKTYNANKILRAKNNTERIDIPDDMDNYELIYFEDDYKGAIDSKNRFEDKAKTIVAALTIAISLILNLSKIIESAGNRYIHLEVVMDVLSVLAIIYMVIAGLMAIQVLIKENIFYSIAIRDRKDKRMYFKVIQQNANQNLIRNNIIYASYLSIRNSVICLLIIFVFSLAPIETQTNTNVVNNNTKRFAYQDKALEWMIDNPSKTIDLSNICNAYNNMKCNGKMKNIYDKNQGIVVTITYENDKYLISDIIDDINIVK